MKCPNCGEHIDVVFVASGPIVGDSIETSAVDMSEFARYDNGIPADEYKLEHQSPPPKPEPPSIQIIRDDEDPRPSGIGTPSTLGLWSKLKKWFRLSDYN